MTNDSQIFVTPTLVGNEAALAFTYGTASSPITVTLDGSSEQFSFFLQYSVAMGTGSVLSGIQQSATFSNTSPAAASFAKIVNPTGGPPFFLSAVQDGGVSNPFGTYNGAVTAITSSSSNFTVTDGISLQSQSGTVSNSGFANNFFTAPPVTTTPEPPASVLIGGGLILVASSSCGKPHERRRRLNA